MAFVRNPETGEVRIVNDPTGLLSEGWSPASPEQAEQYAQEVDLGGFGEQAQAQAERVVRGATLGAVTGFGDEEENRQRAEVSERLHPAISFAADVAPQVGLGALAAATGGAAAVGLGAAAGGLVAGGAALAAESAAGGLVGAAQAAYQRGQYLGEDPGRDAENALIFGGMNFGLGAASKALFGSAEKAAVQASRFATEGAEEGAERASLADVTRAAEQRAVTEGAPPALDAATGLPGAAPEVGGGAAAVSREAEREAIEDGLDRALSNASRSEARELVEEAVGGKVPSAEVDSFGRQRRLYQNRAAILDVSVREMQSDLTELVADLPAVARGGKLDDVTRLVGDDTSAQRFVSDGIAQNAAELAGQLRGEARAFGASVGERGMHYEVPGSKGLVQALQQNADAIAEADTGRAMFDAVNTFKQTLDDHKVSFEAGKINADSTIGFDKLIPRVAALASKVRSALEDGAVWGKAGDAQKAYNAVIHDQLIPSMRIFEESVLKRTSKGYDALWSMEGWESKIESLLKGNDLGRTRHVNGVLDAIDNLASVRAEFGDGTVAKRTADRVGNLRRTMGLAEEVQDAASRMEALGEVAGSIPLLGGAAKQWVTGDLANAFRRLTNAADASIDRGVDDWIASSRARGDSGSLLGKLGSVAERSITGSGDDSVIAQIARRQGISHSMARFMGQDQSPQAAFERARAALQDDERFFQSMGQDYKSLQQFAPETFLMLAGRASAARQFLLEVMPPNVSVSMMRPQGYPPARESIEDWALYWNAVRYPTHVTAAIGSARIQELQTLERVYPRYYERTLQRVIEKVGAAQQSGKPLDDNLLFRMGALFPLDCVASPAFSRQAGRMAMEWTAAQQQSASPTSTRTARGKTSSATSPGPVQAIAANGATFGSGAG